MGNFKVIGYVYGTPSGVDATKLTHVNYAFAAIQNGQVVVANPGDLSALVSLKSANPNLKVVLSVGGWGGDGFSDAALTSASRNTFAESCRKVINDNALDGIDLDWEYPVNGGWGQIKCRPEDKQNFTLMLQAIRDKIGTGKILSIASGAGQEYANNTELSKIAAICDYINIMTYDFGSSTHNANLYDTTTYSPGISCDWAVKNHISHGVPASKINMGVPFYGRTGSQWITYAELVQNYVNKNGWTRNWDNQAKACYLTNQGQFLTYDDEETFDYKTEYIKNNGLGGVMFWQYNQDYQGRLVNKLWSKLGGSNGGDNGSKPGAASLSVDNANNSGNYTVTVKIPAKNTATSMNLHENGNSVKSQSVTANSNSEQVITHTVKGKAAGVYTYRADLTNQYGTTSSANLSVTVSTNPTGNEWTPGVSYQVGDVVTYQGKSYVCRQAHTALATWMPPDTPALWLEQ